jgi:hypothetical protein
MDDHAGRLVDDQHGRVFVSHLERNELRLDARIRGSRQDDADLLAAAKAVARTSALSLYQRSSVTDEPLGMGAADARDGHHGEVETAGWSAAADGSVTASVAGASVVSVVRVASVAN